MFPPETGKVLQEYAAKLSNAQLFVGYSAPENMQHYAVYLDTRIRAYRELKHDAVRVQAESNRDMRNNSAIEEDNRAKGKQTSTPARSKTIMGRKLRVMTVEKGLLRETRIVHKMIYSLVECRVCFTSTLSPRLHW